MATLASDQGIFGASQKIGLTTATFIGYIVPPLMCQYFMGVLVQLEGTRFYRFALLPVLVWFAWRGMFVDMSGGDPKQGQMNVGLITHMVSVPMRGTVWAIAREPFRRQSPSNKTDKSDSQSLYTALWNAFDLMFNVRGVGWNWPRGLVLPKPTFETESRTTFVLLSTARLALYAFGLDACIQTLRILGPDTFGSLNGGSLFDHTLPPLLELARSVLVSFLTIWMGYFMMQWSYHVLSVVCIILLQQRPSQWPPLFDSPWLSTSLTELWGRRWHQMMRELLVTLGMQPFSYLFGRLGGVFGAFLFSGIFHDIELRAFGRGGNSVAVIGFWVMNSVGVVLERVWKKTTGRRVGGVWGWMWTFGWLGLWGVWVVDAWAMSGRFGALSLPGEFEPSVELVRFVRRCLVGS
ncbi:hypothetical protein L210DRAFT_3646664 [Boletus edulis BED1]|uniref:Wax synthase domain-containing protein n=1 Tax=Boletus edulis BED1 TaxID=1328754 RepID=A0AAD4BRU5_BOLED|nr:hypothetical protein L210DRAFT_3646664 [Boletus edulis BED1]